MLGRTVLHGWALGIATEKISQPAAGHDETSTATEKISHPAAGQDETSFQWRYQNGRMRRLFSGGTSIIFFLEFSGLALFSG